MSVVEPPEELADIRAYDAAKLGPQDAVPFEKAIRDLRSELVAMPCAVDILRTAQ